ncbi:App1 family protein [Telluribacter sp.]|jgi:phosphatidate phosphatase APP1|uniref:App1 family protein n=1 Tax=Telluribacter sp. TaxID=1978767 RepID=UPI002E0FB10A|nr:App1 family protein [Telluribacter sp.]
MRQCELKLYRGYANNNELVVFGHAFRKYPSANDLYDRKGFKYINSILQLFTIKTIANARVVLHFGDFKVETKTLNDGFFEFNLPLDHPLSCGWHNYEVRLEDTVEGDCISFSRKGELLVPYEGAYTIISDIDDTFLISYSGHLLKKLYVMLTKNVESRLPFEDVVKHYRLLSFAGRGQNENDTESNTFFYVSSSEWNLYEFITRFTNFNGLPKAVLKLKSIKSGLGDFLMTGGGSHEHKERKIRNIIKFYPHLKFILLGDDSQRDPHIYEVICKSFPLSVRAVYIRQTESTEKREARRLLDNMTGLGVDICYFRHSSEAILHSVKSGIITQDQVMAFERKEAELHL